MYQCSIDGEILSKCREIQEQMNLNSVQMEKLVIFLATLPKQQQSFVVYQLNIDNHFDFSEFNSSGIVKIED